MVPLTRKEKVQEKTVKLGEVLYQAAYEGLNSICTSIPNVILSYLEKEGVVGPGQIIKNPQTFDEELKKMFGFGANVLEKKILEILYDKLKIDREARDNVSFPEEIQAVERTLASCKVELLSFETVNV